MYVVALLVTCFLQMNQVFSLSVTVFLFHINVFNSVDFLTPYINRMLQSMAIKWNSINGQILRTCKSMFSKSKFVNFVHKKIFPWKFQVISSIILGNHSLSNELLPVERE